MIYVFFYVNRNKYCQNWFVRKNKKNVVPTRKMFHNNSFGQRCKYIHIHRLFFAEMCCLGLV